MRPHGILRVAYHSRRSGSASERVRSVSMVPGATALTLMRCGASWTALDIVSIRTPALEISYGTIGIDDATNPDVDARFRILPPAPCLIMTAAARCVAKNADLRLIAI